MALILLFRSPIASPIVLPRRRWATKPPAALLDRAHPLARGLVGYWPMVEGAGGPRDHVGTRHGTLNGNAAWGAGAGGPAVLFDGTGDDVLVSTVPIISGRPAYSIFARVRTVNPGGLSRAIYTERSSDYPAVELHAMDAVTTTRIIFTWLNIFGELTQVRASTLPVVNDGRWHVVGATYRYNVTDGVGLWQDGIRDAATATITGINTFASPTNVYIGRDPVDRSWDGGIEWVALWDRALTADEIAWIAAEPFALMAPAGWATRLGVVPPPQTHAGAGAASATGSATATATVTHSAVAAGSAASTATAAATVTHPAASTASAASTATADGRLTHTAAATASATSGATASAIVTHPAATAGSATSGATASATATHPAAVAASAVSTATAGAQLALSAAAVASATSGATATATVTHPAIAAASATSDATAAATVTGSGTTHEGAAVASATSDASATATVDHPAILAGSATANATAAAQLGVIAALAGTATSGATAAASVTVSAAATATATGSATATARVDYAHENRATGRLGQPPRVTGLLIAGPNAAPDGRTGVGPSPVGRLGTPPDDGPRGRIGAALEPSGRGG